MKSLAVIASRGSFNSLVQVVTLLMVFLRHAGCTFCREALADLALHLLQQAREVGQVLSRQPVQDGPLLPPIRVGENRGPARPPC